MIKHNLLLFLRNIKKNRTTFSINVIGMSIGLASVLFIAIWAMNELSVDRFHKKGDRLVQILQNLPTPNGIETEDATQGPLAKALLNEFPEVEESTAVLHNSWFEGEKFLFSDGTEQFFNSEVQFAGTSYFNMFSFPLVYGNPDSALPQKNSVVVSEALAKKLFQTTNAIGKTLVCLHDEFGGNYTISGVFKELPKNSSEKFDAVFNFEALAAYDEDFREWNNSDAHTYVLLAEGTSLVEFNTKIKNFLKSRDENASETYLAQLYSERYLYGKYENGKVVGGRVQYTQLFAIIALLILIIACVNFVNLSTARASTRTKEIGVKKSMGAERRGLLVQFTIESMVTSGVAMLLALVIVRLLLPQFNYIAGRELTMSFNSSLILGIVSITLFTGFVAGIYPALYLSGLSTLAGLKGKLTQNLSGDFARKGLVVFQFAVSILLIVSVLIVYKQMDFVQNKNLGFNRENVVWFNSGVMETNLSQNGGSGGMSTEDIESFVDILNTIPGVVNASNFRHTMMSDFGTTTGLSWPGKDAQIDGLFAQIAGGHNFIETMQIELKEGRTYSKNYNGENEKIIFNEAAIEQMGILDPIGKTVNLWGEDKQIIGVVENFHIDKLYSSVMPVFMTLSNSNFASNFIIRIEPGNQNGTLDRIRRAYRDYFVSGAPLEFSFLSEDYDTLYRAETRVATLSKFFAAIATTISCLGLFGLAVFTAQRRKKEISIRKVLGQSATQVVMMLSGKFLKLVFISILVALPIAYLLATNWLSQFAYRIELHVGYFIGAGTTAVLVALLTVGSQAVNAANKNPVHALKDE